MGNWSIPKPDDVLATPKEQFVWPPRKQGVIGESASIRVPPEAQSDAVAGGESPSRPAPARVARSRGPDLMSVLKPPSRALSTMINDIERSWLDLTAAPLHTRMLQEGWLPDAPGDYCPRCGLTVDRDDPQLGPGETCAACEGTRPPWKRLVRLGEYQPPLSRWVCEVKFTRWRRLGRDLGRLLGAAIQREIERARAAGEAIPPGPPVIVPVPTTFWRLVTRGIDHSLCIARGAAEVAGAQIIQPLTREARPSQTKVAPSHRQANVSKAFGPRRRLKVDLSDRLVIVLDDVLTTGATLRAACRAIQEAGSGGGQSKASPCMWVATIARTPPDAHDSSPDGDTYA